ncbi:Phage Tail Collar Domain protein [compost metagenome]
MAQGFTANAAGMEVRGVAEAAAFMSFHRPGYFAAYFGLDVDNKFKIGGWSMGALAYELVHEGNSHLFNGAPGQVAAFAGAQPPAGWLKANGAAVSRATYARLFAAIGTRYGAGDGKTTFNLPDLRGEFIRGWDDARGLDASRGLGSVQSAMLGSHGHTATAASAGAHTHAASCDIAGEHSHTLGRASNAGTFTNTPFPGHSQSGAYSTSVAGAHAHTISVLANGAHTHAVTVGATGGHETRPRNIALLYCIKY